MSKSGGRTKGTPNKRTSELAEMLHSMNCCPAEGLVRVAQYAESEGNWPLALDAYKSLLPYLYPKRKAIAHSVSTDEGLFIEYVNDGDL